MGDSPLCYAFPRFYHPSSLEDALVVDVLVQPNPPLWGFVICYLLRQREILWGFFSLLGEFQCVGFSLGIFKVFSCYSFFLCLVSLLPFRKSVFALSGGWKF